MFYKKYFETNVDNDEPVANLPSREVRNLEIDHKESRIGRTRSKTIEIAKYIHDINMVLCATDTKHISEPTTFKNSWNHPDKGISKNMA